MSRRRLLFLGAAGGLGVLFGRQLTTIFTRDPRTAPGDTPNAPHGGGHENHEAAPSPADSAGPKTQVRGAGVTRWSDPATWGGKLPGPGDVATIDSNVLLDINPTVAGVVVDPAGSLTFDPGKSRTLTSRGNVIVRGRLIMRPGKSSVVHKIAISGAKESTFRGGGAIPLPTDAGVWITGSGVLDAIGTSKRGWLRAAGSIAKGTKQVTLASTPTGWRVGDEVVITPTVPVTTKNHHSAYDTATITSISGRTIGLSRTTANPHPAVTVAPGKTFAAEVLNLTRNVRIEGKPGGRTHVFINSRKKQTLKYLAVRHVGPRQGSDGVLGRYGIHFHMVGGHSRGSLVEGSVVRDAGFHAFVPHASDGVTFKDCVSHNTMGDAYWWDPGEGNATRDALYDRCVASLVHDTGNDFRLTGFWLGHGIGNTARGCVAVGVAGRKSAAGFLWPEKPGARGDGSVWGFRDCVAHNNNVNGIFVWQNNDGQSVIDRFTAFHNGKYAIEHGAYRNVYVYKNSVLYGNGIGAAAIHAVSGQVVPLSFDNVVFDGAGRNEYLVSFEKHTAQPDHPTKITGCTFRGYKKSALGLLNKSGQSPDQVDAVNCSFAANEFWLGDGIDPKTVIRVQDSKHGSVALRPKGQPGTYHPEWNASVTDIANFA